MFDLAIAGGGVMGLACALEEARRGRKVGLFDPAGTEAQASHAAAGILVTRDAHVFSSPFREFYVRSIRQYPQWLAGLAADSGREVPLRRVGDWLVFDLDDLAARDRLETKTRQLERERSLDFTVTDRLPDFLRDACPLGNVKALHFPGEAYVQNRDLLAALRAACEKAGVAFRTGGTVRPWEAAQGLTALTFAEDRWEARQVLLAAGAWSARLLQEMDIVAPMVPVKGQMLRIPRFHASESMVHFNDNMYLVPRGDSLVVGATTEPGTWNEGFDGVGEAYVETQFRRLLPGISRRPLESWSGLRPRTRDRLPWMGWLDQDKGWALCTGHYKCGISMAPLAAQCLSKLLHGEKTPFDLAPFNPWRKQGLVRLKA
ncbi:MAG TPA: FAD-dependent oxidoreductase [Fibrobacteria bacterium]|nr:FAD-dependent oxidoreductase [Fibrobacteria bacterium]